MKTVWGDYAKVDEAEKTAVAIGNFDGIHKGHQKLLTELKTLSDDRGLTPVVYTFQKHPINILKGEGALKTITDITEKEKIFSDFGINTLFFESFETVKNLAPEAFVKQILVDRLHMKLAVVGENNRFGKNSEGNAKLLCALGEKYGFCVHVVKPLFIESVICSSSQVRTAVLNGDVSLAKKMLGRPFRLSGTVINGKKLGRTYGFPTANITAPEGKILPKYGVYATTAYIDGKAYPSITNVGITSFDKVKVERVETHLIGYDGDLYGLEITVDFLRWMRGFVAYRGVDALQKQLTSDREDRLKITEEEQ